MDDILKKYLDILFSRKRNALIQEGLIAYITILSLLLNVKNKSEQKMRS